MLAVWDRLENDNTGFLNRGSAGADLTIEVVSCIGGEEAGEGITV